LRYGDKKKDQPMPLKLASNLLYDTDQETLFEVDEIRHNAIWTSARVYQSAGEGASAFEVWFFEWYPDLNEEKPHFIQTFQTLEEAKSFALQLLKNNTSD
jgi:hypothetical protein